MSDPALPATDGSNNNFSSSSSSNDMDAYFHCGLATVPGYPEARAAVLLESILYPFLLILGTLGNGVSLLVLGRLSGCAWSTCLYLAVLSAVELAVLYIRCGGMWFYKVVGVNPFQKMMTSSDAMCKTFLLVVDVLEQLWPWLVVALSVELLIATRFPFRTYRLCTGERARAAVLLITILLVCLNLHYFWTHGLVDGHFCIYTEAFSPEFMNDIWPSISMAVQHCLPLLVVSVTFFVSAVSLLKAARGSGRTPYYEPVLKRYFLDLRALEQLKHVALTVLVLFLVVKTFTFIVELIKALEARSVIAVPCEQLPQYQASLLLAQTLRDLSVYSFFSLKFFVYFALCASFRQHVLTLLRKMCVCGKGGGRWDPSRTGGRGRRGGGDGSGRGGAEGGGRGEGEDMARRLARPVEESSADNTHRQSSSLHDVNGHYQIVELSKSTKV